MPRPTNFVAFIRNIVREQVNQALQGLLSAAGPRKKAATGRRRRRRRHRGPGRPPGSKTRMRRGPGRPPKTEQTAPTTRRRRRRGRGRPPESKTQMRRGPGRPPKTKYWNLTLDLRRLTPLWFNEHWVLHALAFVRASRQRG